MAEALQAALHQERAQFEVLLTDPVALVVLFLLGQVLSTTRHLQTTLCCCWLAAIRRDFPSPAGHLQLAYTGGMMAVRLSNSCHSQIPEAHDM